jgi:hypothetical protein
MATRAAANIKGVISSKCPPSVMTLQAVVSGRSPVLQYGNVRYLLRIRSARSN